jgi:hypothetical protein
MIFNWTKQFLMATGIFALVLTGQTMTLVLKEKRATTEQLDKAQRTVRVIAGNSNHIN